MTRMSKTEARIRARELARIRYANRVSEERPIPALPDHERGDLENTYSLAEVYWHSPTCQCGSCAGRPSLKTYRIKNDPTAPSIGLSSRLPPLPYLTLLRLQVAEEATQSKAD